MPPKFTPERYLSAPRRSPAVPNEDGTLALYYVSTYSFDSHSQKIEVKVLHIESGHSILFSNDATIKEAHWLKDIEVLWLQAADGGATEFWIGNAVGDKEAYLAGKVDAPLSNLKVKRLENGNFAVVVVGLQVNDELYNPVTAPKPKTSAREYTTSNVRYWDSWYELERRTLWYTTLEETEDGEFKLSSAGFKNALKHTTLECPFVDGLSDPDGAFDLSRSGIIFTCRDPCTNLAKEFKKSVYYLSLSNFEEDGAEICKIEPDGFTGLTDSPIFSPDGTSFAFTTGKYMEKPGYQHIFVTDVQNLEPEEVLTGAKDDVWDYNPGSLMWSNDGRYIYCMAEDRGAVQLFQISIDSIRSKPSKPIALSARDASVLAARRLTTCAHDHRILVTRSNYIDSSIYEIIDSNGKADVISSATKLGSTLGLHASQVSEFYFKGAGDYKCQAHVMKPSNFSADKIYPLALLIHGGPQDAWNLAWTTRWNPALFAEQGYVVVLPNPTGSTGFGEAFWDSVVGDWGGKPYDDLIGCFEHIKTSMPYVDTSRAVALGASFGSYMINWIAGQPFAKSFKAFVSQDGIFSNVSALAGDLPIILRDQFGVPLWKDREAWRRHDPAQYTHNWTVPMLVIHSSQDYRCPITEGWAAYTICQERGIESRYLNFPDENHQVLKPENALLWCKSILGWINKYTNVDDGVRLEPPVTEPWAKDGVKSVAQLPVRVVVRKSHARKE